MVVYYSRTGHTRTIAEAIAAARSADMEEIVATGSRRGLLGWLRSAREAWLKKPAAINAAKRDPTAYDLVVLGSPVWASSISSPMRAYLVANGAKLKRIALFCTLGGAGGDKTLREMAELCGKEPVATTMVTEQELRSEASHAKVAAFLGAINET
jgi:flavodoxin